MSGVTYPPGTSPNEHLANLEKRVRELEPDAMRYRWLRQWVGRWDEFDALHLSDPETPADMDRAIDAALAKAGALERALERTK